MREGEEIKWVWGKEKWRERERERGTEWRRNVGIEVKKEETFKWVEEEREGGVGRVQVMGGRGDRMDEYRV